MIISLLVLGVFHYFVIKNEKKKMMPNNLDDLGEQYSHQVYLMAWGMYQMKMLLLVSLQDVWYFSLAIIGPSYAY